MSNWYYLVGGQQEGPIPQEDLLQKFTSGELPTDTFIWSKGMKDWLKAADIDGFLKQAAPASEPETPAAPEQPMSAAAAAVAAALADEPEPGPAAAEQAAMKGKLGLAKKSEPEPAAESEDTAAAAQAAAPAPLIGQQQFTPPTQAQAAYLYISPFRLIFMSIFSFGLYELYWIYKNWKYAKERDGLNIMPFWRAWFGIFHCHNLLRYVHTDRVLTRWQEPNFKPGLLATIWVVMQVIANFSGNIGSQEFSTADFLGPLWPSFLCFLPVQLYINRVNKEMAPEARKTGWTFGHIVITIWSLCIWGLFIGALFFSEELAKYLEGLVPPPAQ